MISEAARPHRGVPRRPRARPGGRRGRRHRCPAPGRSRRRKGGRGPAARPRRRGRRAEALKQRARRRAQPAPHAPRRLIGKTEQQARGAGRRRAPRLAPGADSDGEAVAPKLPPLVRLPARVAGHRASTASSTPADLIADIVRFVNGFDPEPSRPGSATSGARKLASWPAAHPILGTRS